MLRLAFNKENDREMKVAVKRLYRVTLRGMTMCATGVSYGVSYVVADDPTSAYDMVRKMLDEKDIGFKREREMASIELIAENYGFTDTGCVLYL